MTPAGIRVLVRNEGSGMTFTRGASRIFHFSPGDQDYPIYLQPAVGDVVANGVSWAAPENRRPNSLPRVESAQLGWFVQVRADE